MDKTIFGVFDNPNDIEPAMNALQGSGLDPSQIEIIDSESSMKLGAADEELDTNAQPGMYSGFVRWLHDWGLASDDSKNFAEAVRRGGSLLAVHLPDNSALDEDQVSEMLCHYGAIDIDKRGEYYKKSGFKEFDENAAPYSKDEMIAERERFAPNGQFAIPVSEENVKVGKQQTLTNRVRVTRRTTETPIEKDIKLRSQGVDVERRATDRPMTEQDEDAFAEGSIEFTESTEEPVVQKEARVKEEVLVKPLDEERTETIRETARRTDVEVDRSNQPRRP